MKNQPVSVASCRRRHKKLVSWRLRALSLERHAEIAGSVLDDVFKLGSR